LALETARAARLAEMQNVLKSADDQFAANLHVTARSILLYRIAGSSDKRAELTFLVETVKKIKQPSNSDAQPSEALLELEATLSENVEQKSVGQLFSGMTDILDTLGPAELYKLVTELRKEPTHTKPPIDSDFSESPPPVQEIETKIEMPKPIEQEMVVAPQLVDELKSNPEITQVVEKVEPLPQGLVEAAPAEKGEPQEQLQKPQESEATEPPESVPEQSLRQLIDELAAGNAKISELTTDLVETKQRLESFEQNYTKSNQRLETLQKELSKVPKRLDEVEESLTSIVRDSLQ
jgi:hypothetical protein